MNINPKQLQKAMRSMGVQQDELEATEVIIKMTDRELVISHPSVAIVTMMGQKTIQVSGEVEERMYDTTPALSQDDIDTVVAQTGVSPEQAREALEKNKGDIAKAILDIHG